MWRRVRPVVPWVGEVVASVVCAMLIANAATTVHTRDDMRLLTDAIVAAAIAVAMAAAAVRLRAPGTAVLACAIAVVGATRAEDAPVAVVAFAVAACVPLAALLCNRDRSAGPLVAVLVASAMTVLARLLFRDPFRELHCEPFCDPNPFLRGRHPGVVRAAELLLAVTVSVVAVHLVARRRIRGPAGVAALAVVVLCALRLVARPRPMPDSAVDVALDVAMLLGLLVIVVAGASGAWSAVTDWREMRAFGRALAAAQDVAGIEASLRRSTGDGELEVHLASEPDIGAEIERRTAVVRDGRTVATIAHDPARHDRVARAVTPSVALALETQLLLDQARRRVTEVDASRALAARSTDAARRALERDLHDGAQQRMLVTGMTLAAAADRAAGDVAARYRDAATDIGQALGELRRIGRGDAATIAELGLDDAATSLAGRSSVPLTATVSTCGLPGHDCWPLEPATAAYRLLVSTLSEAEAGGAGAVEFEARCLGDEVGRLVRCLHDGAPGDRALSEDRVVAAGGDVRFGQRGDDQIIEARFP